MSWRLPQKEVKVKAHAFTMAAVVWFFFVPFALFFLADPSPVGVFVGVGILFVEAVFVFSAIRCFRKEKKQRATWIETGTHVGVGGVTLAGDYGGGEGGGDGGD